MKLAASREPYLQKAFDRRGQHIHLDKRDCCATFERFRRTEKNLRAGELPFPLALSAIKSLLRMHHIVVLKTSASQAASVRLTNQNALHSIQLSLLNNQAVRKTNKRQQQKMKVMQSKSTTEKYPSEVSFCLSAAHFDMGHKTCCRCHLTDFGQLNCSYYDLAF